MQRPSRHKSPSKHLPSNRPRLVKRRKQSNHTHKVRTKLLQPITPQSSRSFTTTKRTSSPMSTEFNTSIVAPQDVVDFWFQQETKPNWFAKSDAFDELLKNKFLTTLEAAAKCELSAWRATPCGRLAEIIVLDQFSRNIYRNTPKAFAQDPLALALTQVAIACQDDKKLDNAHRMFLYMPYMHSESKQVHVEGMKQWEELGNELTTNFALQHKVIVDRFGRYPHRNLTLGRESTEEELEFLTKPGSSF